MAPRRPTSPPGNPPPDPRSGGSSARRTTAWALPRHFFKGGQLVTLGVALTVAVCLAIRFGTPYVNGPAEWRWAYWRNGVGFWPAWLRWMAMLAPVGCVLGIAYRLLRMRLRSERAHRWAGLGLLVAWGAACHVAGIAATEPAGLDLMANVVLDETTTSFYTVAQGIGTGTFPPMRELLPAYDRHLSSFPMHAITHPPGPVIACYAVRRFFETRPGLTRHALNAYGLLGVDAQTAERSPLDTAAATTIGLLLMLGGLAAVFPLSGLIRLACAPSPRARRIAWVAAVLWVHHPALLLFEPEFDQVYPTLALCCLYACVRGLRSRRPHLWGLAIGALYLSAVSLSFTLLFLAPILALLAMLDLVRQAGSWRPGAWAEGRGLASPRVHRLAVLVVSTVAAALLASAAARLAWGIDLARVFGQAVHCQNTMLLPVLHRSYAVWAVWNLYDFLFFAGVAVAVPALIHCGRAALLAWRRPRRIVPAWGALLLGLVLLDATGLTPGETGRIWLFLAPGFVWAAATELVRHLPSRWALGLGVLLLAQSAFVVVCRTELALLAG